MQPGGPAVASLEAEQYAVYGDAAGLLTWSRDGRQILIYGGKALRFYDVQSRKETGQLQFTSSGQGHLALSPDGALLASTWLGVDLWDVTTQSHLMTLEGSDDSADVAFSPDGALLVTCGLSPAAYALSAVS